LNVRDVIKSSPAQEDVFTLKNFLSEKGLKKENAYVGIVIKQMMYGRRRSVINIQT